MPFNDGAHRGDEAVTVREQTVPNRLGPPWTTGARSVEAGTTQRWDKLARSTSETPPLRTKTSRRERRGDGRVRSLAIAPAPGVVRDRDTTSTRRSRESPWRRLVVATYLGGDVRRVIARVEEERWIRTETPSRDLDRISPSEHRGAGRRPRVESLRPLAPPPVAGRHGRAVSRRRRGRRHGDAGTLRHRRSLGHPAPRSRSTPARARSTASRASFRLGNRRPTRSIS